jgi:TIR domain
MRKGVVMARVFISHRGADQAVAERLARALRDRGHDVWIDIWKIDVGDSIVGRINAGLSEASFLLLCGSNEPFTPWVDREWMPVLMDQLEGADVRLLPVLLTGDNLPFILKDIKYANLVLHWQEGIEAICKVLG